MGTPILVSNESTKKKKSAKMKATLIVLIAGLALASAIPKAKVSPALLDYKQALKAKSIGCDICTFVVTEVDKILVQAETEQQFIDAVEVLCAQLDSVFAGATAACNALVETYLPQIIEGLVNNQLSPANVCGALTLC